MNDHRRSASRSTSRGMTVPLSGQSHPRKPSTRPSPAEGTPLGNKSDSPNVQPPVIRRTLSRPPTPPSPTAAPAQTKRFSLRSPRCSLPPRGYLRNYELVRIRARTREITPWLPNETLPKNGLHPTVHELLFPLALAQRGGVPYLLYLGGAVILLATAVLLFERAILALLVESGSIWELPIVIAPFLSLVLAMGLRLFLFPLALGLFSLPVRVIFQAGSLDLVTLCDETPHAVRRSCSTSWVVTLKLLRRLLGVIVGVGGCILVSHTKISPSIILLLSVSGALIYLIVRIPLLCAPILSVVADYGRRYAARQAGTILGPCAHKLRLAVIGFVVGWFVSHLILRSILAMLGIFPWPLALWINLCLWVWYAVSYSASLTLHQAFLYEQMVSPRELSTEGQPRLNPIPTKRFSRSA